MSLPEFSDDFEAVATAERAWIARRRAAVGQDDGEATVGLALSGGGIRSATFNLGALQALADRGLLEKVDYVSSVSGGGYIASCLTWLRAQAPAGRARQPFALPAAGSHGSIVDWLRAHGKYLVAAQGFTGWTLGASILAATLLNLVVMIPPLMLLLSVAALDWLPLTWPAWAQIGFAQPVHAHDGFALMLWAGSGFLALYPPAVLAFAVLACLHTAQMRHAVQRVRRTMGLLLNAGLALLAIGLVPLVVRIEEALAGHLTGDWAPVAIKAGIVATHLVGGLAVLRRTGTTRHCATGSRTLAVVGLAMVIYGLVMLGYHLVVETGAMTSAWFWGAVVLSLALAWTIDVNSVSMHGYYRSRLVEAFMPAIAGPDDSAAHAFGFPLKDIDPDTGAPYHIVNATLSTPSSKQQTLRSRGAASFVMTPLVCGSAPTGYRSTSAYRGGRTALSTAFTISGAAVDPNTEVTRSRPVAFLMALLNARLGFWAPNPRLRKRPLPLPWWYLFIAREMLGTGLDESRQHVHLTDGGHFDNLGLYELLRRRCRHIVVLDAGADPEATLSDLGLVMQRARADFGVDVDIQADALARQARLECCEAPWALGSIHYADGSKGEILYVKPMMRAGLTADIYAYWRTNPAFPNQSTADQFFDETQFNAYRELGRQIVMGIGSKESPSTMAEFFEQARGAVERGASAVRGPEARLGQLSSTG